MADPKAENLVLLCRRHHRPVPEGGWRMELGEDGEASFHRPDGTIFPKVAAARSRRTRTRQGR